MTISAWLDTTTTIFKDASIPTARLDAEVLLADALLKDRAWILAHPNYVLQGSTLQKVDEWVERRKQHEPIAYIRGKQEFYGREFYVSPATLTPRPETETIIEMLIEEIKRNYSQQDSNSSSLKPQTSNLNIVDVGTGSGCIVITAALELPQISNITYQISYLGLDISKPALKFAGQNATQLGVDVVFKQFDLLKNDLTSYLNPQASNLILANLPYVPTSFTINLAATHEPEIAIYGGEDGLDYYRQLFKQLSLFRENGTRLIVFTEALPPQHEQLQQIAKDHGYTLKDTKDFIQMFERS